MAKRADDGATSLDTLKTAAATASGLAHLVDCAATALELSIGLPNAIGGLGSENATTDESKSLLNMAIVKLGAHVNSHQQKSSSLVRDAEAAQVLE